VASKLNSRVINRLLENMAVDLEKGGSKWLRLMHHLADRALKQVRLERAVESHKIAQLPSRTEATRFLRKPDSQLSPRERKCLIIRFRQFCGRERKCPVNYYHATSPIQAVYVSKPRPSARRLRSFRPYVGPVLFDLGQTRGGVRLAVNRPPVGWNVGEGRPQAVLLLVVEQDEKAAVVVERITPSSGPAVPV
jgi:hypothetical protein